MKTKRHLRSVGFGILFGFTYAVFLGEPNLIIPLTLFALLGVLVPNLDFNFKVKVTKTNWLVTAFLVPFLVFLIVPRTVYIQSMLIGYYGHVVNDLDKKNNIEFAIRRAYVGALWIIALMLIMSVFRLSFGEALGLFS